MSDRILLAGIELYGHIGVSAAEREVGQRLVIDVELELDLRPAAATDEIGDTVNYAEAYGRIMEIGQNRSCHLLEPLAEEIAQALLASFPASAVMVRVKKRPPPMNGVIDYAGVEIRRSRAAART